MRAGGRRACRRPLDQALGRYGRALGRAFQIVDDILDCTMGESTTGKSVGRDLQEGKLTLPVLLACESDPSLAGAHPRRPGETGIPAETRPTPFWPPCAPRAGSERARKRALAFADEAIAELAAVPASPLPGRPGGAGPAFGRPGGLMSASAPAADVRGMFDRIAGRYDRANRIMSAGVDVLWRRQAIAALLDGLGDAPVVLDLGAGTLDGAIAILRRRPGARVCAADFARNMLVAGRRKPAATRVAAQVADAHALPYRDGGLRCRLLGVLRAQPARPAGSACASCAGWCGRAAAW